MVNGLSNWTDNREDALWFYRRRDAESFCMKDETVDTVILYGWLIYEMKRIKHECIHYR